MITLASLAALKAAHKGIEYTATSRDYVDASDAFPQDPTRRGALAGPPTLTINFVHDDDRLAPLLDDLAGLGVTWPLGRVMHIRDDSPIASVWGEVAVLDGEPPWRVEVSIHHNRRRAAPKIERGEV